MEKHEVNRRDFIKVSAAGATALSLSAASYGRVRGANEDINVAFVGVGGRCQEHIGIITNFQKEKKGVRAFAVCDVWDGFEGPIEFEFEGEKKKGNYLQGLYPSAKRCGLKEDDKEHVTKDYRRILDNKDVDVVCIATPDHWHAKISIDAAIAGKDVYCEKPMTRTIDESHAVVDAMKKNNRVMTVGVQSMADPTWQMAYDYIKNGGIGHVAQAQTSYYRNYLGGQWRYYALLPQMNPKTVDWDMFLGHGAKLGNEALGPKLPFDRAIFGQWRCYWPFGGGMFTDLFVHQTTHMIKAMGVRYPARVVGGGGLYLEYDGRDVPDVATVVADYNEGCQLIITATMINDQPIEECIRGRLATIRFVKKDKDFGFEVLSQTMKSGPGLPKRLENKEGKFTSGGLKGNDTEALWTHFLECVRNKNRETLCPPELGAAAFTTVNMGVQSYRQGKALFWDAERRKPTEANSSWASNWEARSKEHGKPNQIIGWKGGESGSVVLPPSYQKLGGPWTDGKDPAQT
ncbi:MAG TPA: Gfo/Idh/MocA family oxidoreductase [Gemmataceae bacterium]|nr:Gfo/Idh/MocA family oxidoreductase [Gemmataceae bacterium]